MSKGRRWSKGIPIPYSNLHFNSNKSIKSLKTPSTLWVNTISNWVPQIFTQIKGDSNLYSSLMVNLCLSTTMLLAKLLPNFMLRSKLSHWSASHLLNNSPKFLYFFTQIFYSDQQGLFSLTEFFRALFGLINLSPYHLMTLLIQFSLISGFAHSSTMFFFPIM